MTRLPTGPLPSMDFETYSSAGYEWNGVKWERLAGADKYGLEVVGVAVYAEHPSTEVLSLAYDLLDGRGVRMWIPGLPPPQDLFDHLAAGGLISAWNDGFEYHVWRDVCAARMGWPAINPRQLRDDAAKARAWGLPGALAKAAAVMGGEQKDSYDKLLWCPKGGSKQPRPMPHDHPENYSRMLAYCAQDVVTEMDLSARIPDLEGDELEFALLTAQMNYRGMAVDMESVDACIATLERAYADADGKLAALTDGAVKRSTQGTRMIKWLATQGVTTDSLDEEHREALLARPWPPGSKAHEALKLFDLVTSAGVKKVYAMKRMANRAGRLCNMYIYHGARTGRDSGAAVQPQNLVKAGHPLPDGSPWSWEHADETLRIIREGRAAEVFDSPVLAVSGCIRSLFVAAPGHDLICSDYSSIEAVVTAALAGEQWRMEAFARGDDIYLTSAGKLTGRDLDWYAQNGGKKHPDRQKYGKPMELGCFAAETKVLTPRGYLDIVDVLLTDKVWDGVEWVAHQGVVFQGRKDVLQLDGVRLTPDHLVSTNGSWTQAKELSINELFLTRALASGSENLPLMVISKGASTVSMLPAFNALAVPVRTLSRCITYVMGKARGATRALRKRRRLIENSITLTPGLCPTMHTGLACSIGCPQRSPGATIERLDNIPPMEREEYESAKSGETTERLSYNTCKPLKVGTSQNYKWIASTMTQVMSRAISGLFLRRTITPTDEQSLTCKDRSTSFTPVYDIVNAGPRNRFTIKTNTGHLVVHNCGFGGWVGALRQFGFEGSDDEAKTVVTAWRKASPAIVEFWGGQVRGKPWRPDCFERFGLEGMAINAVQFPGRVFTYRQISYQVRDDVLYCKLPSGRELAYHRPKLAPSTRWENTLALSFEGWNSNPKKGPPGWQRMELYGGLLCENCIAEGTEVLTDRGWVKIENVQDTDRVHDGVGFVNHGGLLFKSVQKCVSIDGVYMTPDHEVLTDEGWKAASQNPKPLRPEIRGAYRSAGREKRWQKTLVDLAVRLRRHLRKGGDRSAQGAPARADTQLRLSNPWHSAGQSNFARHVAKPGVCGMAQHEGALFKPRSRSMEELRRSRHSGMRRMVAIFRGFLAGYGADLPTGFRTGPPGQQRRVQCGQLPMGNARHEFEQPAHVENDKDAGRHNERCRSLATLRHRQIHDSLPNKNGLARGPDFKVYDIVNAGPRHRFVVRGENGPFIVHNCVQATARDILRGGVIALERAGYPIVLRVHDEIAAEVPEGWGSIEEFERLMATIPPWAEGWPIKAAGGWRGKRYRKD